MQPEIVLWLDNQLPAILAKWIKDESGIEAHSAHLPGLQTETDYSIFQKAKSLGKIIIITKDADFSSCLLNMEVLQKSSSLTQVIYRIKNFGLF